MFVAILVIAGLALSLATWTVSGPRGSTASAFERCWTVANHATEPRIAARSATQWNCAEPPRAAYFDRLILRYRLLDEAAPAPRFFTARLGGFETLTLIAQGADGAFTYKTPTSGDFAPVLSGPHFWTVLPETEGRTKQIYAVFDGISHNATYRSASIRASQPNTTPGEIQKIVMLAMLLGTMLIPLFYDLAFYRVLKERFMLWHAMLIGSFGLLLALRSGLIHSFVPLSMTAWRFGLIVMFGVAVACAFLFTRSFLEDRKRDPRLQRLIPWAATYAIAVSLLHACNLPLLRPLGGAFHTYAMAPLVALFVLILLDAARRGSRLVRFLWVGWAPLLLATVYQLASYLVPILPLSDALPLFYVGILCETVATALGVADRFMTIKRRQVAAELRAREADNRAAIDPLTGLLNRRALTERFETWRHEGFDTFAVLDLDRFKTINDEHGHGVGDQVLAAVGSVLPIDQDCRAVRLGGEEFLLLLRGKATRERAERLRQLLPVRIAEQVPSLDRIVTASMGLIELPRRNLTIPLGDLYTRADQLLYEAKEAGRNRLVAEKLTVFPDRRPRRREAA